MARYEALRATCAHADKLYAATTLLVSPYDRPLWYHELDKGFHDLQTKGIDSLGYILNRHFWLVDRPHLKLSAEINQRGNLKVRWEPLYYRYFAAPDVKEEFETPVHEFCSSGGNELIFMRNPAMRTHEDDLHYRASHVLMYALSEYWLWMIGHLKQNFELTIESHFSITPSVNGEYFNAYKLEEMDRSQALDLVVKPLIQTR